MRQIVEIKVFRKSVYDEVEKTLEYIAAKRAGEGKSFDHARLSEASQEMLERFWQEACGMMHVVFADYLINEDVLKSEPDPDDEEAQDVELGYMWKLNMPSNYDAQRNGHVEQMVYLSAVYHIVHEWLKIVAEDKDEGYEDKVSACADAIVGDLHYRVRPKRESKQTDIHETVCQEVELVEGE